MATTSKNTTKAGGVGAFLVTFMLMFFLTAGFLGAVDALPEGDAEVANRASNNAPSQNVARNSGIAEKPVRVEAPAVGLNTTVANPSSTNVTVLDQALLKGSVRYPTSAELGVNGTVLLFGHSSYLPVVHNKAYKAFNKIQDLKKGDTVSVYSSNFEYRYKVVSVRIADATEDVIELNSTGKRLVLVTCDSFTSKSSRFVVTAEFVGTYSLASN